MHEQKSRIPFSRQTAAAFGALEGATNFAEEYAQYPEQDKAELPVKRETPPYAHINGISTNLSKKQMHNQGG
jgi:hypothetical protein